MVNVYCDLYYIYITYVVSLYHLIAGVFARKMHSTTKNRNDSSDQVCDSCWIRHGGMNPSGNTLCVCAPL